MALAHFKWSGYATLFPCIHNNTPFSFHHDCSSTKWFGQSLTRLSHLCSGVRSDRKSIMRCSPPSLGLCKCEEARPWCSHKEGGKPHHTHSACQFPPMHPHNSHNNFITLGKTSLWLENRVSCSILIFRKADQSSIQLLQLQLTQAKVRLTISLLQSDVAST